MASQSQPSDARALLDLPAAGQGRQRTGHAPERALLGLAALGALVGLDRLPVAEHLLDTVDLDRAEDVRVATHDLGSDGPIHVGQVEGSLLGRELGVEDHLQQNVAELLGEVGGRPVLDGIDRLVGLLQQVGAQGAMRLLPIPRAAVRRAQTRADGRHAVRARQVVDRVERFDEPRALAASVASSSSARRSDGAIGQTEERMAGRIQRGEHVARPGASVATGEHIDVRGIAAGQQDQRDRGIEGDRGQVVRGDDLDAGPRVDPRRLPAGGPRPAPGRRSSDQVDVEDANCGSIQVSTEERTSCSSQRSNPVLRIVSSRSASISRSSPTSSS